MIGQEPSWEKHERGGDTQADSRERGVCVRICREQERHHTRAHAQRGMRDPDMQKERERSASLMLRKHLINLAGCSEKRGSLRNDINFPSDIMAWHGGGQSTKNECL
jgi:hypothetical protein